MAFGSHSRWLATCQNGLNMAGGSFDGDQNRRGIACNQVGVSALTRHASLLELSPFRGPGVNGFAQLHIAIGDCNAFAAESAQIAFTRR